MKKRYQEVEVFVAVFRETDVISTSPETDDEWTKYY